MKFDFFNNPFAKKCDDLEAKIDTIIDHLDNDSRKHGRIPFRPKPNSETKSDKFKSKP